MKITRSRVYRREPPYVGGTSVWGPGRVVDVADSTVVVVDTDLNNYVVGSTGHGGAIAVDGRLVAPDGPGLGVEPAWDELGEPVAEYR